jgi:hypothetical protein
MRALIFLSIVVSGILIPGCSRFVNDGPLEELIEEGIEELTGLDVDITSEDGK